MNEEHKKKFILEFDEPPALVFVSHDGKNEEIYKNGERVRDWTAIKIDSAIDKFTEYDLSLVALKPKEEWKKENKKNTPHLDELSHCFKLYCSRGYRPSLIKMNPMFFAELTIETINSPVIQQGKTLGDIKFEDIPIKMNVNIDGFCII